MKRQPGPLLLLLAVVAAALLASGGAAAPVVGFNSGATASLPVHRLRRVEDVSFMESEKEEAAYPRRRVLYDSQYIGYGGLAASQAACYGPCPARGRPYTGRGCQAIYQCRP